METATAVSGTWYGVPGPMIPASPTCRWLRETTTDGGRAW